MCVGSPSFCFLFVLAGRYGCGSLRGDARTLQLELGFSTGYTITKQQSLQEPSTYRPDVSLFNTHNEEPSFIWRKRPLSSKSVAISYLILPRLFRDSTLLEPLVPRLRNKRH
jgi:hypothetical protein